jgi:nucleoside-diphosphate-sugar epimerase
VLGSGSLGPWPMVVLVTGQGSALAAAISAELTASGFTVRLARLGAGQDERGCSSEELVAGASQIILVEPAVLASILPASAWLDVCTRCVYDILIAAADHAVPRVLVLSSMDVFLAHAPDGGVMPVFQPLPSCELSVLAPHMAEFACREFAMCGAVEVLAARLGTLVTDPPRPGDVLPPRWWVQLKEAAAAVGDAVRGFAGPTPLSRRHAHAFDTINLAHGAIQSCSLGYLPPLRQLPA